MPSSSQLRAAAAGWHAVQFYGHDQELAASVGSYLIEGLLAGESVLVVATLRHRQAFEAELARAGIDVVSALAAGRLLVLDAARTLQTFCADGQLDRDRFDDTVASLLGPVAHFGQPVRIYAEMVALLWDYGHVASAIELEALWNDLGSRFPFSLLCAYPARLVTGTAQVGPLAQACGLHEAGVIGPQAARNFPQALESARAARNFVLDTFGSREDARLATDAAIVTAELAANAVLHARSDFSVAVSRSAAVLRISVRDGTPLQAPDRPLAVRRGHGLWVVAKVADDWGVDALPDGKVIWAELASPPSRRTGAPGRRV